MTQYKEHRRIPHTPENLYHLVMNVAEYPEFLPWCMGARIRQQTATTMTADLMIGFQFYREKFTSRVTNNPDSLDIDVEYAEGPFKYLQNSWRFKPDPHGCEVEFFIEFEFRSMVFQAMIEAMFAQAVRRMVRAFEKRADTIYPPLRHQLGKQ